MPLGQHNTIIHNICLCCGADRKKKGISIYFRKVWGGSRIIYKPKHKQEKKDDKNKVLRAEKLEHLLIHLDDRYVAL